MDTIKESLKETHVRKTIASFVGLSFDKLSLLREVPERLQDLLLRSEEFEKKERDGWGNFEHSYAKNYQEGHLWEPEVDIFAKEERARLQTLGVPLIPLWPPGYSFALVLTHDVDHIDLNPTYTLMARSLKRAYMASDLDSRALELFKGVARFFIKRPKVYQNAEKTLQESLRIEKALGVTASYFFTLYPLEKISRFDCLYGLQDTVLFEGRKVTLASILKKMDEEGFDVGLHGSYFSALDQTFLLKQKQELEKVLGKTVETTRQHWLHFKLPDTLNHQAISGLKVDTTLGYNRNIGYRAGTGFPFFLFCDTANAPIPILELPLILQDGALLGSNALEFSVDTSLEIMKQFVDKSKSLENCLTLLTHPDIFLKPGLSHLYETIIRYALMKGAFVTNVKDMARYWEERNKRLGV